MKVYNISNILTVSRIAVTPLFLYLFFLPSLTARIFVLALIVLSEISDMVDGYLARKNNMITDFGKIADPLADRIFRLTLFLCFVKAELISVWFFALCFYRDCMVTSMRIVAMNNKIVFAAQISGKIKAVLQATAIITITLLTIVHFESYPNYPDHVYQAANYIMLIVTLFTVWSGVDYFTRLRGKLKDIK